MTDARQWTQIWVRRTLRRMPAFAESAAAPPDAKAMVPEDDHVIGVYVNGPAPSEHVIITEDSIVFHDEEWKRARFAEITRAGVPKEKGKLGADRIDVELDDRPLGSVIIAQGGERHRDVFEFLRFLGRVVATHRGEW